MSSLDRRLRMRASAKPGALIAALDIGCSKVACLIARVEPTKPAGFEFLGGGRQQSRGFSGGAITDLESLERAVRLAVEDAERQAGERVDRVMLGVTGPKVTCRLATAGVEIGGRTVASRDVQRVLSAATSNAQNKGAAILSANAVAYRVDDQDGVRDPRGLHADRLGVLVSTVLAPRSLIRNLQECLARAHLGVDGFAPSAIASALGVLIDDERENGAFCIDMGAGVTTASVFLNGAPAWLGLVSAGGEHVTSDIAQWLGTTYPAAERLKTVYGTAEIGGVGCAERIEAPKLGDDGRLQSSRIARGDLAGVIAPRISETFELIVQRLNDSKLAKVAPRRAVVTGGASELAGVRDLASTIFQMPVRVARPASADILGETFASPAFSTAAGLLAWRVQGRSEAMRAGFAEETARRGASSKVNNVLRWLQENF